VNITRRDFGKYASAGLLALGTLDLSSCSASDVFTDIENWIPVGLSAFQGIVSILQGAGLVAPQAVPLIAAVITGLDDVLADVKAYEAIVPPPANALAKIQAALSLVVQNIQAMLAQLNVNGGTVLNVVEGLAEIILSTIAGFLNELPSTGKASTTLSNTFRVGRDVVSYTPQVRTRGRFKKDYNRVAVANGYPGIQLKLTPLERF
jgi:hypothetical protein